MKPIIQDIFRGLTFTDDELLQISGKLHKTSILRKEHLIEPGKDVNHFYYIHAGCLRTYFIDPAGKEHTLQFAIKGWWTSDYIALFGKGDTKSVAYIECIQDATLYKVAKSDFDELCREIPKVSRFHVQNLESAFAAFQRRILENLMLSAKERYIAFVQAYPNIEQSVKNYHIASYLGITTESLSRIRRNIALD